MGKIIFVVGHLIYALLWLLPTPILFHLRFINTTFLLVLVIAGIWRGDPTTSLFSARSTTRSLNLIRLEWKLRRGNSFINVVKKPVDIISVALQISNLNN